MKDLFIFESESSTKVPIMSKFWCMEGIFFTFQEIEIGKSFEKSGPDLLIIIIFHAWKNRTEQVNNTRKVKMYSFFLNARIKKIEKLAIIGTTTISLSFPLFFIRGREIEILRSTVISRFSNFGGLF